jgi:hypothetical protein
VGVAPALLAQPYEAKTIPLTISDTRVAFKIFILSPAPSCFCFVALY